MTDDAPTQPTVVLVHGAWHGPWCWEKVTPLLDDAGVHHVDVELPLTSFEDDVAATTKALDQVNGPIVLCGHSYGGVVITEAGNHPQVQRLVYLAAFACDVGESPTNTAVDANAASRDLSGVLVIHDDGTCEIDPALAASAFFNDCSEQDASAAAARLRPMNLACLGTPVTNPAWKHIPATYAVCGEDQAVHPELQQVMAKRCTDSVEWPTGHSPFLNRPDLVADLLIELARA